MDCRSARWPFDKKCQKYLAIPKNVENQTHLDIIMLPELDELRLRGNFTIQTVFWRFADSDGETDGLGAFQEIGAGKLEKEFNFHADS